MNATPDVFPQADRSLLIVEDDKPFLERLARASSEPISTWLMKTDRSRNRSGEGRAKSGAWEK